MVVWKPNELINKKKIWNEVRHIVSTQEVLAICNFMFTYISIQIHTTLYRAFERSFIEIHFPPT